jgi:hypothetical protein
VRAVLPTTVAFILDTKSRSTRSACHAGGLDGNFSVGDCDMHDFLFLTLPETIKSKSSKQHARGKQSPAGGARNARQKEQENDRQVPRHPRQEDVRGAFKHPVLDIH